ncbi:putative transducin wd40 repeat-like superfamily protein [Erysiphe necator]|uniref:Putative transducin wd40 repeat-like superfamily protein n=1 Tax=Uncinula necator TaxID=52586 RepID=A0A0B1NX98_UNCNE|nr:putative transducin wd40 repeat-like superfamily protein [Erysiphe necator]
MDFSKSSIAKLAGSSNYQVWAIKMKSYLIAQDLWKVIQLKTSTHTNSNIKSQNSKVISLIILACEDHVIKLLDPDDLAATAWKKLEQQYGHIGFSARHLAFQSLVSTNISSCESVDHFIDQFRTNMNTLSQRTTSTLPQWLL